MTEIIIGTTAFFPFAFGYLIGLGFRAGDWGKAAVKAGYIRGRYGGKLS